MGDVVSKLAQLKRVKDGAWGRNHQRQRKNVIKARGYGNLGAKHPAAGQFFVSFWKKMAVLMPFWITFRKFSESFERGKFLRFESPLNKSLPLHQVKSKTRLKLLILGLNFVTRPGQGNQGTLLSATLLALNHSLEDLPLKIFVLS